MQEIYNRYKEQTNKSGKYNSFSAIDNYIAHLIETRDMRKYLLDKSEINNFVNKVGKDIVKSVENIFAKY